MKKTISIAVCLLMLAGLLSGCGEGKGDANQGNGEKIKILTTIFPIYDWTKNVLGDKASEAELSMLMDNGTDLHSYQATAEDIMKIAESDILITVGGESEEWIEDAVEEAKNPDLIVIDLMEALGDKAKEEEVIEGMEGTLGDHDHDDDEHHHEDGEEAHDHEDEDEDHDHDHDHEGEEPEYDEHIWLSLKNAEYLVDVIAQKLGEAVSANKEAYAKNADSYIEQLTALDMQYEGAVNESKTKTLLFGDRFPFRYMIEDYGLKYFAAFIGCSSETEASFETVKFLADKLDELKLPMVLTIEGKNKSIAETIISNAKNKDVKIGTLDSMQAVSKEMADSGDISYLKLMEANLEVIKEALK